MNRHQDTCQHLLSTGREIFSTRGFSSVGLSTILQQANVPKGSFYHYFRSKEQFGQAVLEDYFAGYQESLAERFSAPGQSALERLMGYWENWQKQYCGPEGLQNCLVVKLSAEVADLSESMRITLRDGTGRVIDAIAGCIRAAIAEQSLPGQDPQQLAGNLYQLWLGASLLTKLRHDSEAMDRAMSLTRSLLGQ